MGLEVKGRQREEKIREGREVEILQWRMEKIFFTFRTADVFIRLISIATALICFLDFFGSATAAGTKCSGSAIGL